MVPETVVAMLFFHWSLSGWEVWIVAVVIVKHVMPREMRDTGLKPSVFCILYLVIASRGINRNQCTLHHQSKVEDHWNFHFHAEETNSPWTRPTSRNHVIWGRWKERERQRIGEAHFTFPRVRHFPSSSIHRCLSLSPRKLSVFVNKQLLYMYSPLGKVVRNKPSNKDLGLSCFTLCSCRFDFSVS